jgi:two-component system sensor histidine kinase/response regulator
VRDITDVSQMPAQLADTEIVDYPTRTISDRVLLVEDNLVNQRVAIAMLDKLGFCTDVVDNGVEAVITATVVPYRAILMDCQIPVLNGYEVTKEIRSQWGASRCSPIIAVTSANSDADRQRSLDAGMDGHLAKPLSLETLAAGMALWAPDVPSSETDPGSGASDPGADDDLPPPVGGSSRPTLDADVVDRLERLGAAAGEDLLGQLVTLFLDDADTRMVALHEALAREDGPALIHLAHTMCGASANLGAAELARLCARLATDGAVSDLESNGAFLEAIEAELGRVRIAFGAGSPSPMLRLVPSSDAFLSSPVTSRP